MAHHVLTDARCRGRVSSSRLESADGFTLLELTVAAALMAGLLLLVFQIVAAVLQPWARETDRTTAALQAETVFEAFATDLQAAIRNEGEGDVALHLPEHVNANDPVHIFLWEVSGNVVVAVYWQDVWRPGGGGAADSVPALFRALLSPAQTWELMRQRDAGNSFDAALREITARANSADVLAAGVIVFEVSALKLDRTSPSGLLSPGGAGPADFFALRICVLSQRGIDRLAALRVGSPLVPEDTEALIREQFGFWFEQLVRVPTAAGGVKGNLGEW